MIKNLINIFFNKDKNLYKNTNFEQIRNNSLSTLDGMSLCLAQSKSETKDSNINPITGAPL